MTIAVGKRVWKQEVIGRVTCPTCGRQMLKSVRRGERVPAGLQCRDCDTVVEFEALELD